MTRKYHNPTLQTHPWHREEETQHTYSHMTVLWSCCRVAVDVLFSLPCGAVGWSVVCDWNFLVILTCFCKMLNP